MCKQTSVIHEIGHTVGLAHEMSRPAARRQLSVNFHHMRLSRHLWAQSQVCDLTAPRVPYDFLSIMHYGTFAGSRDGNAVFVTRNPLHQHLVDHNDDVRFVPGLPTLSHLDRYVINTEYGCYRPESCTLLLRGSAGTQARASVDAATYLAQALAGVAFERLARDACSLGLSVLTT
ncbi:zinc metalloproteinase nas-36-like [Pollicipes pollicipes]|uniref:zinc metalloproteinase nas-36-like n=1 Tax=Pollicipes pollicipes TaxID=41117 RepID=UPI001884AFD4|nr:zinc metalloproteinase nas-36-like [Pollicipes pollicipes]